MVGAEQLALALHAALRGRPAAERERILGIARDGDDDFEAPRPRVPRPRENAAAASPARPRGSRARAKPQPWGGRRDGADVAARGASTAAASHPAGASSPPAREAERSDASPHGGLSTKRRRVQRVVMEQSESAAPPQRAPSCPPPAGRARAAEAPAWPSPRPPPGEPPDNTRSPAPPFSLEDDGLLAMLRPSPARSPEPSASPGPGRLCGPGGAGSRWAARLGAGCAAQPASAQAAPAARCVTFAAHTRFEDGAEAAEAGAGADEVDEGEEEPPQARSRPRRSLVDSEEEEEEEEPPPQARSRLWRSEEVIDLEQEEEEEEEQGDGRGADGASGDDGSCSGGDDDEEEAEEQQRAAPSEWPQFERRAMGNAEALGLWAEMLLKNELDPDFERLLFATPRDEGSQVWLSAAFKAEALFAGARANLDSAAWSRGFRRALQTWPELTAVQLRGGRAGRNDDGCWVDCEACGRSQHPAESCVRLRGARTDALASWVGGECGACPEGEGGGGGGDEAPAACGAGGLAFNCGRFCTARAGAYHAALHFKSWAIARLRAAARPLADAGQSAEQIVDRLIPAAGGARGGGGGGDGSQGPYGWAARGRPGAARDLGREIATEAQVVLARADGWLDERVGGHATGGSGRGRAGQNTVSCWQGRGALRGLDASDALGRADAADAAAAAAEDDDSEGAGSSDPGAGSSDSEGSDSEADAFAPVARRRASAGARGGGGAGHTGRTAGQARGTGAARPAARRAGGLDDYFGEGGLVEGDGSELMSGASSSETEAELSGEEGGDSAADEEEEEEWSPDCLSGPLLPLRAKPLAQALALRAGPAVSASPCAGSPAFKGKQVKLRANVVLSDDDSD